MRWLVRWGLKNLNRLLLLFLVGCAPMEVQTHTATLTITATVASTNTATATRTNAPTVTYTPTTTPTVTPTIYLDTPCSKNAYGVCREDPNDIALRVRKGEIREDEGYELSLESGFEGTKNDFLILKDRRIE